MNEDNQGYWPNTGREASKSSNGNQNISRILSSKPVLPFGSGNLLLSGNSTTGGEEMGRLLTVEEVASLLNVPRKWVYRRVVLKPPEGIPHVKVGKYLRFRESDLRDYVERLRRN